MVRELPTAATEANYNLASYAITNIHNQARADEWASDNDQVGFDFSRWVANTSFPEVVDGGGGMLGIMNVERMGTYEDFEKIRQPARMSIPRDEMLWHTGQRMNDSFRRLIVERPANRHALSEARQAIWGDTTPQWWFKNYGSLFPGAYPMKPGTLSIETGGWETARDMEEVVSRHVNAYLRREGLLV